MNRVITLFVRTAALFAIVMSAAASFAADGSSLKPPPGARVAIVVFEDMECPDCARAFPLLQDAGKKHSIPVVLRDFPLSMHPWSFDAAVFARYFDTKSKSSAKISAPIFLRTSRRSPSRTCASMRISSRMTISRLSLSRSILRAS